MDIGAHVAAIGAALEDISGEDEQSQALADRMTSALAPALHLQLLDLLGEVAMGVSDQLPDGHLDLQLAGRDAVLIYRPSPAVESRPPVDEGTDTARLTLRMPESLKNAIEVAAASDGLSTNAWLVSAARRRLSPTSGAPSNPVSTKRRITGYVQA